MMGHWGYKEVFRSPIVMNAQMNSLNGKVVHLMMRQWTRRKSDPITHQFCLSFTSEELAESFVFAHNRFLLRTEKMEAHTEQHMLQLLQKLAETKTKTAVQEEMNFLEALIKMNQEKMHGMEKYWMRQRNPIGLTPCQTRKILSLITSPTELYLVSRTIEAA